MEIVLEENKNYSLVKMEREIYKGKALRYEIRSKSDLNDVRGFTGMNKSEVIDIFNENYNEDSKIIMYNELGTGQKQRIINLAECMRIGNIATIEFDCNEGVKYYLSSYVCTIELSVQFIRKENGASVSYTDKYKIDEDNYIYHVESVKK